MRGDGSGASRPVDVAAVWGEYAGLRPVDDAGLQLRRLVRGDNT